MGTFRTALVAAALGIAGLASAPAQANLIVTCSGQTGCNGEFGTAIASSSTNTFAFFVGSLGQFNINTLTITGADSSTYLMDNGALDVDCMVKGCGKGNSLTLYLTETNLTAGAAENFIMNFGGTLTNVDVTRTFYLDTTDSGLETTFLGSCINTAACNLTKFEDLSGEFSLTEQITIKSLAKGGTLSSDDKIGVPEPGTLSLFGMALVGLGAMRRRRKASKSA